MNRAIVLNKQGKKKEALNDLNQTIKLNDEYVKAVVKRGEIYMELEQYEDALRDFEKAG